MYHHFAVLVHPALLITQIKTDTEVYSTPTVRRRVADSICFFLIQEQRKKKPYMQNSTDDIFMFVQHRFYFILHINFKRSGTILFVQKNIQRILSTSDSLLVCFRKRHEIKINWNCERICYAVTMYVDEINETMHHF